MLSLFTPLAENIAFLFFSLFAENGDPKTKIEALKRVIQMILNGEKIQNLLMTVIRFVMPLQDHTVKKLLLIFWEVVPKYAPDGKMLHEMILVCDAYRKVHAYLSLYGSHLITKLISFVVIALQCMDTSLREDTFSQ